jgi:uncharacterized protein (DUF305 family)
LSVGALLAASARLEAQQRSYYSDERIAVTKGALYRSAITNLSVKGSDTRISIPPVMPAEAFRLVDYLDLSEQNLTYYMATRDTFAIRLASTAEQKASDQRVRDIATMIWRDRTNRAADVDEIIRVEQGGEGVGTAALARDAELQRLRELAAHFDTLSAGSAFDAAYLRTVFFLHQNEIDVLTANLKNAHDDDFERLIEDSIRSMTQTREVVRTVSQAMGVSLP